MPIKTAITINVIPALCVSRGLKAGTPLLIASMPVKAVQPAAKVCSIRTGVTATSAGGAVVASEVGPFWIAWISPIANIGR